MATRLATSLAAAISFISSCRSAEPTWFSAAPDCGGTGASSVCYFAEQMQVVPNTVLMTGCPTQ